jgi:hypothetical protein
MKYYILACSNQLIEYIARVVYQFIYEVIYIFNVILILTNSRNALQTHQWGRVGQDVELL